MSTRPGVPQAQARPKAARTIDDVTAPPSVARTRDRLVVGGWAVVVTMAVIGPMAGRGWVVLLDWVNGPRVGLADRIMSGRALPAGPVFYSVAAALQAAVGATAGWLLPALCLVVGGWGASLLGPRSLPARLVATTAYIWNPFVHERLYGGQVAVLMGAALLPYVVVTARRLLVEDGPLRWRDLWRCAAVWAVASAVSIHFLVLGGMLVLSLAAARVLIVSAQMISPEMISPEMISSQEVRARTMSGLLAVTMLTLTVTACWLIPIAGDAPQAGDARTIDAFATRAAGTVDLLLSTAGQSGFWRDSPGAPGPSSAWWWTPVMLLLAAVAVVGAWSLRRSSQRTWVLSAGLAAGAGWLLGQGVAGPLGPVVRALIDLPGMGIMREPGKFLVLVTLGWCAGLAAAADVCFRHLRAASRRSVAVAASVLIVASPVALTPGLAWGVGGRLRAARYPSAWTAMRTQVDARPGGELLVLPWVGYVDPGFTGGRVVRHPAPAFFGDRAVVSDDVGIGGLDASARTSAIDGALRSPAPARRLAELGIDWVLAAEADASVTAPDTGLTPVVRASGLVLLSTRTRPTG